MLDALPIFDRLQDSYEPVSDIEIRDFESAIGVTFPDDYRQFLLSFNGGYWKHQTHCRVRNPDLLVDVVYLKAAFGIIADERSETSGIWWNYETYLGRVRDDLIPIMNSNGDPLFMGTSPQDHGKIYVWDHTREGLGDNLYLISDSFTEFLLSLYPVTDEEFFVEKLPVFQAVERAVETDVREYLCDGGKVDCRNAKGQTLLMCAARSSWPKIVCLLLEHGSNPNAVDRDKLSPLYHAVSGQSNDSIKLLLSVGADSYFRDPKGRNLAQIARDSYYFRLQYTIEDFWQRQSTGGTL